MNTSQDSGNAMNIANFKNLINFCIGFGAGYNPTKDALKIPNLQSQLTTANTLLQQSITNETVYIQATDTRRDLFAPLKPLATKVLNAFSVSGVPDSAVAEVKTINRKIQGKRASSSEKSASIAVEGETPQPKTISSSQQSYEYMVEHFYTLIELIRSHSVYNPNEDALKVSTLQAYLTDLQNANNNVMVTNTAWTISRANRNKCLYSPETGLVDTALDVKNYVKAVFGTSSMEYGMVKGIPFKDGKL